MFILTGMILTQLDTYNEHSLGVTVQKSYNFPKLPFPAFSICIKYFDFDDFALNGKGNAGGSTSNCTLRQKSDQVMPKVTNSYNDR